MKSRSPGDACPGCACRASVSRMLIGLVITLCVTPVDARTTAQEDPSCLDEATHEEARLELENARREMERLQKLWDAKTYRGFSKTWGQMISRVSAEGLLADNKRTLQRYDKGNDTKASNGRSMISKNELEAAVKALRQAGNDGAAMRLHSTIPTWEYWYRRYLDKYQKDIEKAETILRELEVHYQDALRELESHISGRIEPLLAKIPCSFGNEVPEGCNVPAADYKDIEERFRTLERIKGNADYAPPIDFSYEQSFEICIRDGKAVLKVDRSVGQQVAGLMGIVVDVLLSPAGKSFSQQLAEAAWPKPRAWTARLSRDTSIVATRTKAASVLVPHIDTNYPLFSEYGKELLLNNPKRRELTKIVIDKTILSPAKSSFKNMVSDVFLDLINGGSVTLNEVEGLFIYRELFEHESDIRANSRAFFCKLVEQESQTLEMIRNLYRKLERQRGQCDGDRSYIARYQDDMEDWYAKLRHDLRHRRNGGFLTEFGDNWSLHRKYGEVDCMEPETVWNVPVLNAESRPASDAPRRARSRE